MRKLTALVSFLFIVQSVFAQQKIVANISWGTIGKKANEIVYKKTRPLVLSDFTAPPEKGSDAVAMAYTGIALDYGGYAKNGTTILNIKLTVSFDNQKSWCLEKAKNEYTLAHEQKHFDITALNACALFNTIKNYTFTADFDHELKELNRKFQEQNNEEQELYDNETNHGINKEQQQKWSDKIKLALADCL